MSADVDDLRDAGLSPRESEVMALKADGLTHAEIADRLDLETSTVDEYSRRARSKFEQAGRLRAALDDVFGDGDRDE